jgi:type II secretory pathway pseudopilin PulG
VVIILGILAAIVVPQFGASTDDARATALESNLAGMRTQVDLYYQQHGHYPSSAASSGGLLAPGAVGTGAADDEQAFIDQMTFFTNMAGQSSTIKDTVYKYGPYMKSPAIPPSPYTDDNTVDIQTTGALDHTGAVAPGAGWLFDNISGQFIADHEDHDHL